MNASDITDYLFGAFPRVAAGVASKETGAPEVAWGDSFFFYGNDRLHPFATIVTKDYPGFDTTSDLNREGVFRLNIGLSRRTYEGLFPGNGCDYDMSALDVLMPHPMYGRNHWICVLSPSDENFEQLKPLLEEAYNKRASDRRSST
jgi:hypothetical protein